MTHPVQSPPVDLTDEEAAARAERMYELDQLVRTSLRAGREAMWHAAKAAHEFYGEAGWSALGYENLTEWLADPGIQVTRTTFHRLVRAYDQTVVRRQIPESVVEQIDVSKVDVILDKVKKGEASMDDALEDAKELGWRDLREKYLKPRVAEAVNGDQDDRSVDELNRIARGEAPEEDEPIEGEIIGETGETADAIEDMLMPLAVESAEMNRRLFDRYAAPEKKKIAKEDREALIDLLPRLVEGGLLDG